MSRDETRAANTPPGMPRFDMASVTAVENAAAAFLRPVDSLRADFR
jgi:hypothetical protein